MAAVTALCVLVHLLTVSDLVLSQSPPAGDECSGCLIPLRSPPFVTDIDIPDGDSGCNITTIKWSGPPTCCEAQYRIDIINPILCNDTITKVTTEKSISLDSEWDSSCTVQISTLYSDGTIAEGPCFIFNTSSVLDKTYYQDMYTDVCVEIVFQSCTPELDVVLTPFYEYNGRIIPHPELSNHIRQSPNETTSGWCFLVSNITENGILTEFCSHTDQEICNGACNFLGDDVLLSRNAIIVDAGENTTVQCPSSPTSTISLTPATTEIPTTSNSQSLFQPWLVLFIHMFAVLTTVDAY